MNTPKTAIQQGVALADLAGRPIYVAWREELVNGRLTKVPKDPASGRNASSTDPKTWGTRKAAERRAQRLGKGAGVGIVLGDHCHGWRRVGFDLDGALDEHGIPKPWAQKLLDRVEGYVDVSPSGEGLHIYGFAREEHLQELIAEGLLSKDGGHEVKMGPHLGPAFYGGGRYLTLAGMTYRDGPMLPLDIATLRWFLEDLGPSLLATASDVQSKRDESGSGHGMRFLRRQGYAGKTETEAIAAIEADDSPAGDWWGRTTEHQRQRALDRYREGLAARPDANEMLDDADVPEQSGGYALTEYGIIEAFVDQHAGELVWDHDAGNWFRFDGNLWRPERKQLAKHFAKQRTMELAARDEKAKQLHRVHVWEAVERGVKPDPAIAVCADDWNASPMLLGTPGGVVDLETGELRPGRPEDRIRKSTAVAPDFEMPHPVWDAFLSQALKGDGEAIGFFQRFSGYTLTGLTREQVLLFIYGRGSSGKTTALETLSDILLDYAVAVATSTLTKTYHEAHKEELARLHGARLAYCSETEKGSAWAENRIKSLTGGDRVTARFMRQNSFEFVPEMKLVIVGNNQPSLSDVDSAIRRRFLILPFNNPPKRVDPNLRDKLRREYPAILAWAIRGALDWQLQGLAPPRVVTQATEDYFEAQDVFGQWLADMCEMGGNYAEAGDLLYGSWSKFAARNGVPPGSKNKAFPETMQQRGFGPIKDTMGVRGRGFSGIRLGGDWRELI